MTNKEIIPYKEAVQLEEIGFDESCIYVYLDKHDIKIQNGLSNYPREIYPYRILAPLYQQTFRFFREKHNIHVYIQRTYEEMDIREGFEFYFDNYNLKFVSDIYDTYEEAQLACLQKLIEIVYERTNRKTI